MSDRDAVIGALAKNIGVGLSYGELFSSSGYTGKQERFDALLRGLERNGNIHRHLGCYRLSDGARLGGIDKEVAARTRRKRNAANVAKSIKSSKAAKAKGAEIELKAVKEELRATLNKVRELQARKKSLKVVIKRNDS
jgi:hypothetical protein